MTLVEVLVALTVFAMGVLGLLGAIVLSSNVASRSERLDGAVALADTKLAQATCALANQIEAQHGQDNRYSYDLTFESRPGGLVMGKVTVQWLESGRVQKYTISRVFLPTQEQQGADE
jgi:Tfp pilus assembly protein PilV